MLELIGANNAFDGLFSKALLWEEQYPAGKAIEDNPHKWIHFTDTPKLEVNLDKTHKDPYGIYFYHGDWLLNNYRGFQYGMVKPHAFMVEVNTNNSTGINVNRMTWNRARSIAQQNGWIEYLDLVRENPKRYLENGPMEKKNWRKPGGAFYATADALANSPEVFGTKESFDWRTLLNGLDYIYDSGAGIIAKDETKQLIVLNPSIITNADYIDNSNNAHEILNNMAVDIVKEMGANLEYQDDKVVGKLELNGAPIILTFDLPNFYRFYITTYRDGILFKHQLMLSGDEWEHPYESQKRSVIHKINDYLEDLNIDITGVELKWNFERVTNLVKQIGIHADHINQSLHDGEYQVWGYGYRDNFTFTTDKSNRLKVEIEEKLSKDYRVFEYEKIFGADADEKDIIANFEIPHQEWLDEYKERLFNKEFEND